jgi:hypothetical protein
MEGSALRLFGAERAASNKRDKDENYQTDHLHRPATLVLPQD